MKNIRSFLADRMITGLLVVAPVYLSILLLLKAMNSVRSLLKPLDFLIPDWLPVEGLAALLFVLILCLLVGILLQTPAGQGIKKKAERSLFERIPGYALFRSFSKQFAGKDRERVWKPALAEINKALVPAFIIEELEDGRYTVFVPSVPTPLVGAVYILESGRVHVVDVSFSQAMKVVSHWGQGLKAFAAAMRHSREVTAEEGNAPIG